MKDRQCCADCGGFIAEVDCGDVDYRKKHEDLRDCIKALKEEIENIKSWANFS